jgi:glyoxylate/hydroxypyruvate reductase A
VTVQSSETPARGGAILLATGNWRPGPWAELIHAADPHRPVFTYPDVPDRAAVRYLLAWRPPAGAFRGLANLAAIFSLGAGVDHLMGVPGLPDVPIARVVSADLTQRMSEWVVLQVLLHHRRQRAYDRQQAARHWEELPQPAAADVRVGMMGLGVLGRDAAAILARLGFQVAGWSRRPAAVPGLATFHGAGGLDAFLARTDILVALLPLTPETRGILARPLFEKLARDGALGGPVVINAGRGGLQVEADIAAAVRSGLLKGASLDVFETEPLPPESPLWSLPDVVVTPHVAATSEPPTIVPLIMKQIADYEAGLPLLHLVDPRQGY